MGCFLGCFGLASSKRKRRSSFRKILAADKRFYSYEPLHSSASKTLEAPENPEILDSKIRSCEPKEERVNKTKKRVTFNLNVQTYEPIPKLSGDIYRDEGDEERKKQSSVSEDKLQDLEAKSYPSNYRYRNRMDTYDEEDEIAYEESSLDEDDYYTDDEDEYETASDTDENIALTDKEMKSNGLNLVLNPVENLAQWKLIKASSSKRRKENAAAINCDQSKPLLKEIAVDASLSSWLASPKNFKENAPLMRNISGRLPILDITNQETS